MAFIEKCYRPGRYEHCYSLFSTLNISVSEIFVCAKRENDVSQSSFHTSFTRVSAYRKIIVVIFIFFRGSPLIDFSNSTSVRHCNFFLLTYIWNVFFEQMNEFFLLDLNL